MAYFALILDWHLYSTNPKLRLLATAPEPEPLVHITSYDPAADFTDVVRASFEVEEGPEQEVRNEFTDAMNPAHVCRLIATW